MSTAGDYFGDENWNITGGGYADFSSGNFDNVEYRIHPEGIPGQMEKEMRHLMGDKEYEQMKKDGQRYREATTQSIESKARLVHNTATLVGVATFSLVALTVSKVLKDAGV